MAKTAKQKPYNWTPKEIATLRAKAPTMPVRDLVKLIGRSKCAVSGEMRRQGLNIYSRRKWTAEQIEAVRNAQPGTTACDLEKRLGHTWAAVRNMARRLGVQLGGKPNWTALDLDALRGMEGLTVAEAAVKLGRTEKAVRWKAQQLGLTLRREVFVRAKRVRRESSGKPPLRAAERHRTCIEWCPECYAPVSNWQEHFERMGHRRRVA
jgi:hypothetical protein